MGDNFGKNGWGTILAESLYSGEVVGDLAVFVPSVLPDMCVTARTVEQSRYTLSPMSAADNGWHKLTFSLSGQEPVKVAVDISLLAFEVDEKAGHPEGFAIFSGWEFGEDNASTSFVLYFSPVASPLCATALSPKSLTPCEKPDRDEHGLGLAYTRLQGWRSWDLLK